MPDVKENFKQFNNTFARLNSHLECSYQINVWFLPQNEMREIPPDCFYKFERELLEHGRKLSWIRKFLLKWYLSLCLLLALRICDQKEMIE